MSYAEKPKSNLDQIFSKYGAFFAFSDKQLRESAKDGVTYVHLGHGLICPKSSHKELYAEMKEDSKRVIAEDLAMNGKNQIIWRELANYECQISGSIEDAVSALEDYDITEAEIAEEYRKYFDHCCEHDLF